jgi:asparagine synthase (glutamine-hydrolysing)
LGRDFWRVAYQAAMLQRCSIWKAMGDAFRDVLLPRPWRPFEYLEDPALAKHRPLPPDAFAKIPMEYKAHPWFADAARLPRNKADQVNSVVALYAYYVDYNYGAAHDASYPFFSQPLAEFALRTPTYVLAHEGLDRALERRAFADLIPTEIARRTGKGAANHYVLRVLQQNFSFYRDLIMDGALLCEGWLDRAKIERMLSPDYVVRGGGFHAFYLLVAAEAWLETWRRGGASAAA